MDILQYQQICKSVLNKHIYNNLIHSTTEIQLTFSAECCRYVNTETFGE